MSETEEDLPQASSGPPTSEPAREGSRVRHVFGGVAGAVLAAAVGSLIWVALTTVIDSDMRGLVAIPIGAAIGAAAAYGAHSRSKVLVPAVAVAVTLITAVLADNFSQRSNLMNGIEDLQAQWSELHVELPDPDAVPVEPVDDPTTETTDDPTAVTVPPECPPQADLIPPPEIVAVLPIEAYECMPAETLAIIYPDVPAEILPQVSEELRTAAEAIIAADNGGTDGPDDDDGAEGGEVADEADPESDLEAARAEFAEADYEIPRPVLACAPPPDFTQETAEAGLGFPDGVPVILPLGDLFQGGLERGDGQDYGTPSPVCFGLENAKDHPLEAGSWLVGAVAAAAAAFLLRRQDETIDTGTPSH